MLGGTERSSSSERRATPARQQPTTTPVERSTPTPVTGGKTYVVRSGDTLSKIAAAKQVDGGWKALYAANRAVVESPDLIFPGERLTLG